MIDSTSDVVGVGGGGVVVSTIGTGSCEGGSSSIRDTSSKDPVDAGRATMGDFVAAVPFSLIEPLVVVGGVIEVWLLRFMEGESAVSKVAPSPGTDETVECEVRVKLRTSGGGGDTASGTDSGASANTSSSLASKGSTASTGWTGWTGLRGSTGLMGSTGCTGSTVLTAAYEIAQARSALILEDAPAWQ